MPSSATTELYSLSLHDALPIWSVCWPATATRLGCGPRPRRWPRRPCRRCARPPPYRGERTESGRTAAVAAAVRQRRRARASRPARSEEHTSELQSQFHLVCRLLRPPSSTLFPYTTLFRSGQCVGQPRPRGWAAGPDPDVGRAALVAAARARHRTEGNGPSRAGRPRWQRRFVNVGELERRGRRDRKSTRLNSSHSSISYAVFCDHRALLSFPTRRSSDLVSVLASHGHAAGLRAQTPTLAAPPLSPLRAPATVPRGTDRVGPDGRGGSGGSSTSASSSVAAGEIGRAHV